MRKLLPLMLLLLAACDEVSTADKKERDATNALTEQASAQVGMPSVTQFTEKRIVRELYELRDKNITTFTYTQDMFGKLHHLCDSIGYGLPYGVQFSNPDKLVNPYGGTYMSMPQAEPNGLFMPSTAEGTWVICTDKTGKIKPMYMEPRVITSPFKLNAVDSYQIP